MISPLRLPEVRTKRSLLKLHLPRAELDNTARWLINGFPATIFTWTADEWSRLPEHPKDAQQYPNGVWCALRIE